MTDTTQILALALSAGVLGVLAIGGAVVLGWASRAFHVEIDPRVQSILDALPGANCGGCGHTGCAAYAEAVAAGRAAHNLCGPGGSESTEKLAHIMGVDVGESWPLRAIVHCAAETHQRLRQTPYLGEPTCAAANLVTDVQGCTYGCLGFGDCQRACPYGAIRVVNGLARVDYEKCTGCRQCVAACPRNIITVVPFKQNRVLAVACSNRERGPGVKSVCSVGCIGCSACVRSSGGMIEMEGTLPRIDYDNYGPETDLSTSVEKCSMESLIYVGPGAAVPAEEEPERIESDFQTTVEKTDWQG